MFTWPTPRTLYNLQLISTVSFATCWANNNYCHYTTINIITYISSTTLIPPPPNHHTNFFQYSSSHKPSNTPMVNLFFYPILHPCRFSGYSHPPPTVNPSQLRMVNPPPPPLTTSAATANDTSTTSFLTIVGQTSTTHYIKHYRHRV